MNGSNIKFFIIITIITIITIFINTTTIMITHLLRQRRHSIHALTAAKHADSASCSPNASPPALAAAGAFAFKNHSAANPATNILCRSYMRRRN